MHSETVDEFDFRVIAHSHSVVHSVIQFHMAGEEGDRAFVPDALTTVAAFDRALRENAASSLQDSAHAKPPLLAVVFSAPWCVTSHQLSAALPSLASHFARVRLCTVDCSISKHVMAHCAITSTPALLVFQHGTQLAALTTTFHQDACSVECDDGRWRGAG